ncbi:hypothetical protein B0H16DRAFT_1716487 [Mycena metata]|uniref:Uncharacterized protein n=1 Tax=Mycena metata TaxID=1033252 RepID=A0AAD7JRD8_9AGAR|nr:hypothetical protein B0H16DRAFT_1716487 [Mycena metata]
MRLENRADGDGVMLDATDVNAGSESEGYEKEFIDDGEQEEDVLFGTPDLTPPPDFPLTQRSPTKVPTRSFKKTAPVAVIELESSEEDLEVMDVDDSMYRKPAGVKATALPPSLTTRSKRTIELEKSQEREPKKKLRAESSARDDTAPPGHDVGGLNEAAMERFMTAFMEKYVQSKVDAESIGPLRTQNGSIESPGSRKALPRIDFDKIELDKGLAASRADSRKSAGQASRAVVTRKSPVWDIESDTEPLEREGVKTAEDKGKGKAKVKGVRMKTDVEEVEDVFTSAKVDNTLAASVAKREVGSRTRIDGFVIKDKKRAAPTMSAQAVAADNKATMAQFFKDGATIAAADGDSDAGDTNDSDSAEPPSTVFLEDLETYKTFYDPDAPCGVYDLDLQDPALVATYRKLPPLPAGRQLLAVYDPARNAGAGSEEDVKGGRAKFSSWRKHLKTMLAKNCIGAMLFVEAGPSFINLSRVSPLRLSKQAAPGASATQRLLVDGQIAVCVSAIFCTESMVVSAGKVGPKTERTRKWLAGIFHNQDWERFESVVCLVFGEDLMYTNITNKKAVSFVTMLSPADAPASDSDVKFSKMAPSDMFSPVVSTTPSKGSAGTSSKPSPYKPRTLLSHSDFLPIFDARKTTIDYATDLGRLAAVLPAFTGDIPFSSFVVVGYSVSSYKANLSGSTERVAHLSCNVLWAIVCGTPVLGRK